MPDHPPEMDCFVREHLTAALASGVPVAFRARGISMYPWIRDGDIVTVSVARQVRPGQVVLVDVGNGLRVHRVIAREELKVWTAGDRFTFADPPVPAKHILGRVESVSRNGRRIRLALSPVFSRLWAALFRFRAELFPIFRMVKRIVQLKSA